MPTTTHAAWTLLVAFALSLAYEIYRVTARRGISPHDSPRVFLTQLVPFYMVATALVALLFRSGGQGWAAWTGIVTCVLLIVVSLVYYNPHILPQRKPRLLDWVESLVYTGLLFVAVTQLAYSLGA